MPTAGLLKTSRQRKESKYMRYQQDGSIFGNLMDATKFGKDSLNPLICGEESFGTGASHIREKFDAMGSSMLAVDSLPLKMKLEIIGSLNSVEDISI